MSKQISHILEIKATGGFFQYSVNHDSKSTVIIPRNIPEFHLVHSWSG